MEISSLSYISLKERVEDSDNTVPANENTCVPYVAEANNTSMSQDFKSINIPYQEDSLVDLLL